MVTNNTKVGKKEIIFRDLSYKVVGALFEVYNQLGSDYLEKHYQTAVVQLFSKNKIRVEKEVPVKILIDNVSIGKHFIDFVVDGRIALDLKKGNRFRMGDIKQMLTYLRSANLRLGLLAYFGSKGVRIKRIINRHFS